jgi:nicotinate-nucleotide adenylyltransferase
MRIGLFGGSFNPPHAAHLAATRFALKRLRLDQVWWIISPGNPLKDTDGLPALADRIAAARALARDPRIIVTDIEAQAGTRYTVDTLRLLRRRCPEVRFVWVMGADILGEFHLWRDWRSIFELIPIAVIDRGGLKTAPLAAKAAHRFARYRLPEHAAGALAGLRPPAWMLLTGLKMPLSSTQLRKKSFMVNL